jgi:hypothetical protein
VRAGHNFRPDFLLEWVNSEQGRAYLRTVAKSTSGLNTINSTVLKAMPVPAVALDQQDALLSALASVDACRQAVEAEGAGLVNVWSRLLAEIFEGN